MATVLHLTGPILIGPNETRPEAWVIDGRLTFERPTGPGVEITQLPGWVVPGVVDAHCHVGLIATGAGDDTIAEEQARTDRDAGTLLIRDAGSPLDARREAEKLERWLLAHMATTDQALGDYLTGSHEVTDED